MKERVDRPGSHLNNEGQIIYSDGVLENFYDINAGEDEAIFTDLQGNQTRLPGVKVHDDVAPGDNGGGTWKNGAIFLNANGKHGNGLADLEHEYGHYLDGLNMSTWKYFSKVAVPSMSTANEPTHQSEDYEMRATQLAIKFFGPNSAIARSKYYTNPPKKTPPFHPLVPIKYHRDFPKN